MLSILYYIFAVLSFPVWFVLVSLRLKRFNEESSHKEPAGNRLLLSFLLSVLLSIGFFIFIPAIILFLVGKSLIQPYEKAVDILYKVLFEKE